MELCGYIYREEGRCVEEGRDFKILKKGGKRRVWGEVKGDDCVVEIMEGMRSE